MMANYGDYGDWVYLCSFKHAFFKFFYAGGVGKQKEYKDSNFKK
jgi:hypothetical protein